VPTMKNRDGKGEKAFSLASAMGQKTKEGFGTPPGKIENVNKRIRGGAKSGRGGKAAPKLRIRGKEDIATKVRVPKPTGKVAKKPAVKK